MAATASGLSLLAIWFSIVAAASTPLSALARPTHWRPDTYPNPNTNATACGRSVPGTWLCDPDQLITAEAATALDALLRRVRDGAKPFTQAACGASAVEGFPVAIALMRRMYDSPDPAAAATSFAGALLDAWALGDPACDNGVLLLAAALELDGLVGLAAGDGVRALLQGGVLEGIVRNATAEVREHRYAAAMENAVTHIGLELAAAVLPPSPPPPPPPSPPPPPPPQPAGGSWWPHMDLTAVLQALEEATLLLCLASGLVFGLHRVWRRLLRRRQQAAAAAAATRARHENCATILEEIIHSSRAATGAGGGGVTAVPATSCPLCFVPLAAAGSSGRPNQGGVGYQPPPPPPGSPSLISSKTSSATGATAAAGIVIPQQREPGPLISLDDEPAGAYRPAPPSSLQPSTAAAHAAGIATGSGSGARGACGGARPPLAATVAARDGLQQPLLLAAPARGQLDDHDCGDSSTTDGTPGSPSSGGAGWDDDADEGLGHVRAAAAGGAAAADGHDNGGSGGAARRRHGGTRQLLLAGEEAELVVRGGGGGGGSLPREAVTLPCGHRFCRPCAVQTGLLLPPPAEFGGGAAGGHTARATCCPACAESAATDVWAAGGALPALLSSRGGGAGRQQHKDQEAAAAMRSSGELRLRLRRLRALYPDLVTAGMAAEWERDIIGGGSCGPPLDAHQAHLLIRRFRKAVAAGSSSGGRSGGGCGGAAVGSSPWDVRAWLVTCRGALRDVVRLRGRLRQARQQAAAAAGQQQRQAAGAVRAMEAGGGALL